MDPDPDALAEVYVGRMRETGGEEYLGFATGYPIARDRVVTAGHVLTEHHGFIKVRFRNSKQCGGLLPATLAWDGRPKFDVAVLSCEIPGDVPANPLLLTEHPSSIVKGLGMGYPRVSDAHNQPGEARKRCDLSGDMGLLESTELQFDFQGNFDLKTQSTGWKGLSGAPVFQEHRMAGIVQEYLGDATPARFRVVAMCRLLAEEAFRAAVGWPGGPPEELRSRIREGIQKRLERLGQPDPAKSAVLRNLERELRPDDDDDLELPEGENPIPRIMEALVDRREFSTIAGLSSVYDERCKARDWSAAAVIAELVDSVTPLVIDPELARRIWDGIKVRRVLLFPAPVNRAAAFEALMALVDGKAMKVKPPAEVPAEDFDGMPSLRCRQPTLGAPGPEALARGILLDLCTSYDVPDSLGSTRDLDVLAKRFAAILIDKKTGPNKGRTLYCFQLMPDDPERIALHTEAVALIRTKQGAIKGCPDLVFVVLAKTSEIETMQSLIVKVLNTRFRHLRNQPAHAAPSP